LPRRRKSSKIPVAFPENVKNLLFEKIGKYQVSAFIRDLVQIELFRCHRMICVHCGSKLIKMEIKSKEYMTGYKCHGCGKQTFDHREMDDVFVEHINEHLKVMFTPEANAKVCCKICGETLERIYRDWKRKKMREQ